MNPYVSDDFNNHGGTYLLSSNAYEDYVQGRDTIGRPDGQFIIPTNQAETLLENHPNDPREWERQLGLNEGSLGDSDIRRVDVYNPNEFDPRLPNKDLSGANDKFIEGGKLPGGQDECVINPFPNPENNPSVGRITNLNESINNSETSVYNSTNNPTSYNLAADKVANGGGSQAPPITAADSKPQANSEDKPRGKVDTDHTGGFADFSVPPANNSSDPTQGIGKSNNGFNM